MNHHLDRPVTHRDVQQARRKFWWTVLAVLGFVALGWFAHHRTQYNARYFKELQQHEDREAAARAARAREIREANERAEAERRRDEYR